MGDQGRIGLDWMPVDWHVPTTCPGTLSDARRATPGPVLPCCRPEFNSMWAAIWHIAQSTEKPPNIPDDLEPDTADFLDQTFRRSAPFFGDQSCLSKTGFLLAVARACAQTFTKFDADRGFKAKKPGCLRNEDGVGRHHMHVFSEYTANFHLARNIHRFFVQKKQQRPRHLLNFVF